jgi:hypothetical protein
MITVSRSCATPTQRTGKSGLGSIQYCFGLERLRLRRVGLVGLEVCHGHLDVRAVILSVPRFEHFDADLMRVGSHERGRPSWAI